MPTLEELFRNKPIGPSGETAEKLYDIRDSKKQIRISASNSFDGVLINNTGFALARLARRNLGVRVDESLLEQEITGLQVIRLGAIPALYGTELPRITLRTTSLLDTMKSSKSGGLLGGAIADARDTITNILGIPQTIIPTKLSVDARLTGEGQTQNRMIDLAAIKKSGEGSLLGRFLKGVGGGSLQNIGRAAIGGLISSAKDRIRGKLFGDRSTTPFDPNSPTQHGKNTSFNYGSISNPVGVTIKTDSATGNRDVGGLKYSQTFSLPQPETTGPPEFVATTDEGGLVSKTPQLKIERIRATAELDKIPKFTTKAREIVIKQTDLLTDATRGFQSNSDALNEIGPYTGTKKIGTTNIDDVDFVNLKFKSLISPGTTANFRSTITGLTETFSPSWDSAKFIGSAFNFYTYGGIERSVSFNFKVYSLNAKEHKAAWQRLNFLTGLTYPGFTAANAIIAPFMEITIGDMYKNKPGFIESLSYTIDDNTGWQINQTNKKQKYVSSKNGETLKFTEEDITDYVLPMVVDVAITIKFLDSKATTSDKKFYNFKPVTT